MIPFAPFRSAQPGATFVASASTTGNSLTSTLGARGILAGDILMAFSRDPGTPVRGSAGAWNSVGPWNSGGVGNGRLYWCVAAAGDLAATVSVTSGGGFLFCAYRAATSAGLEGSIAQGTADPLSISGFNPNGMTIGLVGLQCSTNSSNTNAFSTPATWTSRVSAGFGSPNFNLGIYDRLYPANQVYSKGVAVTVTNTGAETVGAGVMSLRA